MKISMYMLEHWFHDDQPVIYIEDHTRSIIGARLFTDAVYGQNEYLYVGKMSDFFPQSGADEVVLVHKRDVMCFESQDLDDIFNRVLAAFDFFEKMEMDMLSGEEEAHPEQCMLSLIHILCLPGKYLPDNHRNSGGSGNGRFPAPVHYPDRRGVSDDVRPDNRFEELSAERSSDAGFLCNCQWSHVFPAEKDQYDRVAEERGITARVVS